MDTGATLSLVPHSSRSPPAQAPRLVGPDGRPIRCWGKERRRLLIGGRNFEWEFTRAEVKFPILGVDFLRAHRLSVSVATNKLIDDDNGDTFSLIEQSRGHTASVMLPANVYWRDAVNASPPAVPPMGGPGTANRV